MKKWIPTLLIGACAATPAALYAAADLGPRVTPVQAQALMPQAQALAAAWDRFFASPAADTEMLRDALPALKALNQLDARGPAGEWLTQPVVARLKVSLKSLLPSLRHDDHDSSSTPANAWESAKRWEALNQLIHAPAFAPYFSDMEKTAARLGAHFYATHASISEEKRQELEESMRDIELALNGNLPAQLAEAEIPAVDASGSSVGNRGQAALTAPVPNPATLSEAQALIEELKRFPNSDREEEIAQKLIALVRQNPQDEALQMAIARGVIGLEQSLDDPAMAAVLDEMARQADAAAAEHEKWLAQRSPTNPRDENIHRAAALGLAHDYDLRYDGAARDNRLTALKRVEQPRATPLHDPITLIALILFSGMVVYLWFFFK